MKYIDLHTHRLTEDDIVQIQNIFAQDIPGDEPGFLFSAGLHPWHIGKVNPEECFNSIELATGMKNMIAIGECGLDRSVSVDFALQFRYFKEQIQIADKHSKPLIIHCVRAYSDIIDLKLQTKSEVPWILHGFLGNLETTQSLIKHGFYFSVGERLLKNESRHSVLQIIPNDRLFLETDDCEFPISEIYNTAARILKIDEEKLIELIYRNFTTIFDVGSGS